MIFPPDGYAPNTDFAAAARPRNELWRTGLGAIGIAAVYIGLLFCLGVFIGAHYGKLVGSVIYRAMAHGATPGAMILLLSTFLAMAVAAITMTRLVHGRRAGTLFGDTARAVSDFRRVALAVLGLNVGLLPLALAEIHPARHLDLATFLRYFPFALVALLVQTGAEELVFRGYLQQQLAARFRSAWIWMLIPSLLFALMHYSATNGPNAVLVTIWAALFGTFAADLTARTGSLGASLGFHFANNFAAFFFIGINGNLNGLSLWSQSVDLADRAAVMPLLSVDFMTMIVAWLLARFVLRV